MWTIHRYYPAGAQPPIAIRAFPSGAIQLPTRYQDLVSVALRDGTANVTPLTTLLVTRLLNRKPRAGIDVRGLQALQGLSDAQTNAAQQAVVAYLQSRPNKDDDEVVSPVDVSAVTDFVSMRFTLSAGDPYFEALKRLHDSLMDSETLDGVQAHMLFGNDEPPGDLGTMLNLDFAVSCIISGVDDGALPPGNTRVVVDRRGVTFGNVDLPFETGDQMTIGAGATFDDSLDFSFTGRQANVRILISEDRVIRASLSRSSQFALCTPVGEVALQGKHPSRMALVRLLVASLADLRFQCDTPTYPGPRFIFSR